MIRRTFFVLAMLLEKNKFHMSAGFEKVTRRSRTRFSPILDDLIAIFAEGPQKKLVGVSS